MRVLGLPTAKRLALQFLIVIFVFVPLLYIRLKSYLRVPKDSSELSRFSVESEFSILYPSYWRADETPNGQAGDEEVIALIIPPSGGVPQLVVAKDSSTVTDLLDVANWAILRNQKIPGYRQTSFPLNQPIEGALIRNYIFTGYVFFGTKTIRCQDLYLKSGVTGYSFSFCSNEEDWDYYFDLFQSMQMSIVLEQNK
jgi:hypothetical protein